uniref:MATE family efflux transporter n=1 Tax=Eshraghiella crossota TaxID=45851 RepID=UPI003FEFEC21
MGDTKDRKGKYEEIMMSKFMKSLCKIAIPVTLQSMLQASFSIVDQIMIGQLGETNISAVGLCGNFSLIFSVVIGAVSTVAGILIAQFIGAEDTKEAWCGFDVSLICGILISGIFMLASGCFSRQILGLYTTDTSIINTGTVYFRIIAFSYIPMAISNILSSWLRCREHATIPFLASFGAVGVNTGLNYLLIFGKLGFPCMGIKGAAIATLISQLLNLVVIVAGFALCIRKDGDKPVLSLHFSKITIKDYFIMIMPILISEFLWSLGQNVESAVYGHLGTSNLAAYTLTCPIQGLIVGALSGLSAAAGVMVGKRLGRKEYDEAYTESKKIMYAGLSGAVVVSALLITMAGVYTKLYRVDDSVKSLGKILLIVFALYAPVKVENMILGGEIIRSGGNTKIIMVIDIVGTWCSGIPMCLLAAYVFKWGIVGVYTLLTTEEIFRLAVSLVIFKRRKWMISLS